MSNSDNSSPNGVGGQTPARPASILQPPEEWLSELPSKAQPAPMPRAPVFAPPPEWADTPTQTQPPVAQIPQPSQDWAPVPPPFPGQSPISGSRQMDYRNTTIREKGKVSRVAVICGALALVVAAGGVWMLRDRLFAGSGSEPSAAVVVETVGNSGAAEIQLNMPAGDPASARAFNARMGGWCAFDGDNRYVSDGVRVTDQDGNTVYDGALYWMNAEGGTLCGVNALGEIITVSGGSVKVLREAGTPSRLTLFGNTLCFAEGGCLYRMDLSGGGESLMLEVAPRTFVLQGDMLYYIARDNKIWSAEGTAYAIELDLYVGNFCMDGEDMYFTLAGGRELFARTSGGLISYGEILDGVSPFAVYGGYVYSGGAGGVVRTPLNGGASQKLYNKDCVAFYILPDGVRCMDETPSHAAVRVTD